MLCVQGMAQPLLPSSVVITLVDVREKLKSWPSNAAKLQVSKGRQSSVLGVA